MKALTVWQPWASLIIAGAKPYEFRSRNYMEFSRVAPGDRIVIHAGARMPESEEVDDILHRIRDGASSLDASITIEPMTSLYLKLCNYERFRAANRKPPARLITQREAYEAKLAEVTPKLTLSAGIGTAVIGEPRLVVEIFDEPTNDSYRLDHSKWAWPMSEIEPLDLPVPARGAQGFWNWRKA